MPEPTATWTTPDLSETGLQTASRETLIQQVVFLQLERHRIVPPGPCPASIDTEVAFGVMHRCALRAGHAGDHEDGGLRWWDNDDGKGESKALMLLVSAMELLGTFTDDDACMLDHHGDCQTHGSNRGACRNSLAEGLIDLFKRDFNANPPTT